MTDEVKGTLKRSPQAQSATSSFCIHNAWLALSLCHLKSWFDHPSAQNEGMKVLMHANGFICRRDIP